MLWVGLAVLVGAPAVGQDAMGAGDGNDRYLQPADVFQLEFAGDPQISPDGSKIVYVRSSHDIMSDRTRREIWVLNFDGSDHRPLITGPANYSAPRWSPDGSRMLYVSTDQNERPQLFLRWMDTGETAKLTNLQRSPGGLSWSPDGSQIAFSMFLPMAPEPFATLPAKPEGADWAPPAATWPGFSKHSPSAPSASRMVASQGG